MTSTSRYARRKKRTRARVSGTKARPRLHVNISNKNVIAQIIDDDAGKTLVYSTSVGQKLAQNLSKRARWAGEDLAKKAVKKKIKKVVFDRAGKRYQGRVRLLAEEARKNGLEF